jgi:hypothetical protein
MIARCGVLMAEDVDDLKEPFQPTGRLTDEQEILQRFTTLFGRTMNAAERRVFFLPAERETG